MISGMYLGEVVRRVLQRMAQDSDLFGDAAQNLSVPFSLRYVTATVGFFSIYCTKQLQCEFFYLFSFLASLFLSPSLFVATPYHLSFYGVACHTWIYDFY